MAPLSGNRLNRWSFYGLWITIALGFLFHSAFGIFNRNVMLAIIFPVNESVWEHLKLGLWPVILMGILELKVLKQEANNIIHAIFLRFLAINGIVLLTFYTYTIFLGRSLVWVDILTYCLGVGLGQYLTIHLWRVDRLGKEYLTIVLLMLTIVIFGWFSFHPPHQPIFMELSY